MIHARSQLFRLVQDFFETRLLGRYRWGDCEIFAVEKADELVGEDRRKARARFPLGKDREIVSLRFGMYDLVVKSTEEAPPLGSISISGPQGTLEESSLDSAAWMRVGEFITKEEIAANA